jgi:hypothetical protein
MWHTILIGGHAVTGVVALVAGLVTMRRGQVFDVYLGALAGMTLFLALAVGVGWSDLETGARVLFTAFAGLAGFMVVQALRARRIRPDRTTRPVPRYLDDVGFTVVALFDGFAVIAVLDAGGPGWLLVGTGVAIAIAGHFALRWAKRVLTQPENVKVPAGARR